ncbi:MAG: carboxymuconolactone decarboxylase family protein [Spirochaeta sp.]|jgi:alkylhydroperoxidase family enzyme|nr:carboxymuconolactone decarboxylase family protein [Spirochaeta sp.]
MNVLPYIPEPPRQPVLLKAVIFLVERFLKRRLLPARLLGWYPRFAVGTGVMEGLVAHGDRHISRRLLQLLRMQVSYAASCPFCIDMNGNEYAKQGISDTEIEALRGLRELEAVDTFSPRERTALRFVRAATATPLRFPDELITAMRRNFSPREYVIIAGTAAQVNYWTRLIQSLGIPPADFANRDPVLHLEEFRTDGVRVTAGEGSSS